MTYRIAEPSASICRATAEAVACARTLIQAGIARVICGPGTTSMPEEEFAAAAAMFREAGVKVDVWRGEE